MPASSSASIVVVTWPSATIRPTVPSRSRAVEVAATRASTPPRTMLKSPAERRTECGGVSDGAMLGSSRAAYSITERGTRNPATSSVMELSLLPRCSSESAQLLVAYAVVAWARSPSTVTDPVDARRPTARKPIADRSCASSMITWPRLGVRLSRSATSSISTRSARLGFQACTERGGLARPVRPWASPSSCCSSALSSPSACSARKPGSPSSRNTSRPAFWAGQCVSTYALTGRDRATAFCTRSSGVSPADSMRSST